MRYKINDIGEEGLKIDLPLTAAWMAASLPDLEARPASEGLAVRGTLQRAGDEIFLRGRLRGALEMSCVRCLEAARVPLDEEVVVAFLPKSEDADDDTAEGGDDDSDLDVAYFAGDEIDLDPEIHDQLALTVPPNPLCSESCAGLCPICGGNRNQNPCDCEKRQRESRSPLAALGKIKI